jgi:hypothetical protein
MEPCDADPCPLYDPRSPYRGALEVNQARSLAGASRRATAAHNLSVAESDDKEDA